MKQTRHLGAYGFIIRNGKIVLIKKSRGAYKGKLDLPGGSFEHGETPEETVIREIKEETNIDVEMPELFVGDAVTVNWIQEDVEENMHHIGFIYKVNIAGDVELKEDADGLDSLGAKWYKIDNLTKDMISPLAYNILIKLGYNIKEL